MEIDKGASAWYVYDRKAKDVDHIHELQLGGKDSLANMKMIDTAVNRSIGAQISQQIRDLPEGAKTLKVVIEWTKKWLIIIKNCIGLRIYKI